MKEKEKNIVRYSNNIEEYDKRHSVSLSKLSILNLKRRIEKLSENRFISNNYGHAMDIGCGTGNILLKLELMGCDNLYGLDISKKMAEYCKQNSTNSIDMIVGDAEKMPIKNSSLDLIVCSSALHHFPNYISALNEIHRVLENGGEAFLLYEKNKNGRSNLAKIMNLEGLENNDEDIHEFSQEEIIKECKKVGFKEVRVKKKDMIQFFYHKKIRPYIPTSLLKDVGYLLTSEIDMLLENIKMPDYFPHLDIYLKK